MTGVGAGTLSGYPQHQQSASAILRYRCTVLRLTSSAPECVTITFKPPICRPTWLRFELTAEFGPITRPVP